jgi:P2-related tail formation protein
MVEPFGFLIRVIEWWKTGEAPGTFRLDIGVQDQGMIVTVIARGGYARFAAHLQVDGHAQQVTAAGFGVFFPSAARRMRARRFTLST